jgi:hypothetical protein
MLDQPASANAFWAIFDACGIRPEYLIPVLQFESGLNPASSNALGYSGLNGLSSTYLTALGFTEADYVTWSASRQLQSAVLPYFRDMVSSYGSLDSGIRVYQANFYPASLRYAPGLDDTIVEAPSQAYELNAVFDHAKKGRITPRDLGITIKTQLAVPAVQQAIAAAYQVRPAMGPPKDPVFGTSFGFFATLTPLKTAALAAGIIGVAGLATWWIEPELFSSPLRTLGLAGARENPAKELGAGEDPMRIQSILFPRASWKQNDARAWLREHDYKSRKVDVTKSYFRFRQEDPAHFEVLRTRILGEGIKAIVGR